MAAMASLARSKARGLFDARLACSRAYTSTQGLATGQAVRERLLHDVKTAMKNKDTLTSTTLRSVLSDVYAADKLSKDKKVPESAVIAILRKAYLRRTESAAQFSKAQRPELAAQERMEVDVLSKYLPPILPVADIDRILKDILTAQVDMADGGNKLSKVLKEFYSQVDKSTIDPAVVNMRAKALLA